MLLLVFVACNKSGVNVVNPGETTSSKSEEKSTQTTPQLSTVPDDGEVQTNHGQSVEIGTVIQFGGYDWLVLDEHNGKVLIISEKVLEDRAYNTYTAVTWEHSDIRAYLNGEFLNSFNKEDRARIIQTEVINNNHSNGTLGGSNTTDYIFLLSVDEAESLFSDNSSRIARSDTNATVWWRLRSPGGVDKYAATVSREGNVYADGLSVSVVGGIRPALWISL